MAGAMFIIGHRPAEKGGSVAERREEQFDFPVSTPPALRGQIYPRKRERQFGESYVVGGSNGLPQVTLVATGGRIDNKAMEKVEVNLQAMGLMDGERNILVPRTQIPVHSGNNADGSTK